MCIDHKNNNITDNKLDNLRWASIKENSRNAKTRKDNTSGCKGISLNKKYNKYEAYININNKKNVLDYSAI